MNSERELTSVTSVATLETNNLEHFKQGVDTLLARRSYFISQVLPRLKEGQDYFTIKGRKSLAKGGSEKLASIYNLTATFERDADTIEMLGNPKGLVAFVCNLKNRDGVIIGQGRGADSLDKNQGDPNKTVKIAEKRAYTDSVIRATGLSDIFTQDAETVYPTTSVNAHSYEDQREWVQNIVGPQSGEKKNEQSCDSTLSEKQRKYLVNLIFSRIADDEEREQRLAEMENLTKQEASQWIQQMCSS
jgi:hypothetical protein